MTPQPRTSPEQRPLEPASQMLIVWKCTIEYMNELLRAGRGVNVPGFGAFTFDVETDLPRTANLNPTMGAVEEQRMERKHLHSNRPVFIIDPALQNCLIRYHGKLAVERPKSQHSVYQRGFQMVYCNPVPIAQSAYLDKNVIKDAHRAIFKAVGDLGKQGAAVELRFNFAVVVVSNHDLVCRFNPGFANSLNVNTYENKMRRSDLPCKDFWNTSYKQKWGQSTLSKLVQKPNTEAVRTLNDKTLTLKIMSLDLVSSSPSSRPSQQ